MVDVFSEEGQDFAQSPLQTESPALPNTPTSRTPKDMEQRKLVVLKDILSSEEVYLNELEILLTPMKALKAAAGTSQPVLSNQQLQTVFYQVPELRDLHKDFYTSLKARLGPVTDLDQETHQDMETKEGPAVQLHQGAHQLCVGDLFLKVVNHLGVYRGFIDNYENAVDIVRKCMQSDQRFRTLAGSMMSCRGPDNSRTTYTFEGLLYKPLDRVTKTTLVLHDLLRHTPPDHQDHALLQEALRISSGFLSGVNERPQCKKAVTVSRGGRRQLIRDGFVVEVCEGERSLRHLFLYTDILLCVKLKGGFTGKNVQYRFCWYMPLAGLRLHWSTEQKHPADLQQRISNMKAKMFHLRHELRLQGRACKGLGSWAVERGRKKLEELELWLLTHTSSLMLEFQSPSCKSHTLYLPSLYELDEWRDDINKLKGENIETVPPDLLTLTSACVKLRMSQQPHLQCLRSNKEGLSLCGTLSVAVHWACGLNMAVSAYVCVEVDGFEFFENKAQTRPSLCSQTPNWEEELVFQVDGAQELRLMCVSQGKNDSEVEIIGKTSLQLDANVILNKWKKVTLSLGQVEVTMSIKYIPQPLSPPSSNPIQQQPVFGVLIGDVAQQEGVLVPHIVRSCAEEVERRGLEEEGIYRISGSTKDIQILKTAFDTNYREAVGKLRSMDVNAVSGALKLYFRELPESLIPAHLFQSLSQSLEIPEMDGKLNRMLTLLQACSDVNRNTFLFLLHHLKRVAVKQEVNKMSMSNLATVFGPSLLRPPVASAGDCGPRVDISQEVEVQVQVVYLFLQCQNLPEPLLALPLDTEEDVDT
ncbi:active breakpoint cluster region-related protein [Chanos chanos]|uniref:Active breakpoint cluster region-related protein n=1 Tax=Chanos chanos TaxID=29144 RepID=A0A6J2VUY2_CHACN|nr:active breakpoint cluster region-related protein-like [Chanos chanos]